MAAAHSVDGARWRAHLDELMARIAGRFARVEPRHRARALVLGLVSEVPRKNCWTLAEQAGNAGPDGMQHLLARASWDTDGVRDDLREFVVEELGGTGAVLVVDETGDLKKGTHTVGVQRQYTGTAGRIENAQVAVYLTYATARGHALIDRALYLPRCWAGDDARRAAGGIPADVEFATKPALARQMLTDALDAGVDASWVAGDEVYGADPGLRAELERRGVGYVLAIACNHRVTTSTGTRRADQVTTGLRPSRWRRLSAGRGGKGPRFYQWTRIATDGEQPGQRWLLIRRNPATGELAYFRCFSPAPVSLRQLVRVAGRRWTVEESFQTSKGLTGLDQHQVRRWVSWHRWTILVMLAFAFLATLTARERAEIHPPDGLIPLTCNEIQHLFNTLAVTSHIDAQHRLRWSTWRRRHQHRARTCHYQRRAHDDHDLRL